MHSAKKTREQELREQEGCESKKMADLRQGARMQSYNNEIVKCLDDLCERRSRLVKEIQREEQVHSQGDPGGCRPRMNLACLSRWGWAKAVLGGKFQVLKNNLTR